MKSTGRARLKAIAIALGAIVTIKVLPLAVFAAVATAGQFSRGPAFALWPALGLAGLAGFWSWAFSRQALRGIRRAITSFLIVVGMAMVAPFLFLGGVLLAIAVLGIGAGALAIAEMWLPGYAAGREP